MKKNLVIGLIVVVLLAVGAFAWMRSNDDENQPETDNSAQTTTQEQPQEEQPAGEASEDTTITYSDNGFSPANLTVTAGTTITVKNNSSRDLEFSSDDHPTHQINSEMNQPTLSAGQSQTFVVNTKGTFGFHDHLNSSLTGTLTVE